MPALQMSEAEACSMMAISLNEDNADSGKSVLTKERDDWDFWGDDEE